MYLVVVVVSLLSLRASQPSVMAQMPSNMPGGQIGGEAGIERAMSLFRVSSARSLAPVCTRTVQPAVDAVLPADATRLALLALLLLLLYVPPHHTTSGLYYTARSP
ncbi:unnamed protein product [Closterium sp. NIES-54]